MNKKKKKIQFGVLIRGINPALALIKKNKT